MIPKDVERWDEWRSLSETRHILEVMYRNRQDLLESILVASSDEQDIKTEIIGTIKGIDMTLNFIKNIGKEEE